MEKETVIKYWHSYTNVCVIQAYSKGFKLIKRNMWLHTTPEWSVPRTELCHIAAMVWTIRQSLSKGHLSCESKDRLGLTKLCIHDLRGRSFQAQRIVCSSPWGKRSLTWSQRGSHVNAVQRAHRVWVPLSQSPHCPHITPWKHQPPSLCSHIFYYFPCFDILRTTQWL